VVQPSDLPELVGHHCGIRRSSQLDAFIRGVVDSTVATGRVSMGEELAAALAAFRACNYERIYLRQASVDQSIAVQRLLGALVEHIAATPTVLPDAFAEAAGRPMPGSTDALRAAVTYVAGMTDRFAVQMAERWLGWDPDKVHVSVA
jgi:dGTPase